MPTKARQINIRVTEEERATIIAQAKTLGITLAVYLRLILKTGRLPKPLKIA